MSILSCSAADCDAAAIYKSKQLCRSHYDAARYAATRTPKPKRTFTTSCHYCKSEFEARRASARFCSSDCRTYSRSVLTCRICDGVMAKVRTSAPQGVAAHNACRMSEHGSAGYYRGCRCDACMVGKADSMREWMADFKVKSGVAYSTVWRRRFRDEMGYWPTKGSADWIDRADRLTIYERDGWSCYLCGDLLSLDTDPNAPKGLTLDHVFPRSLGGTHAPDNLKTCCRECNTRKSNKVLDEAVA